MSPETHWATNTPTTTPQCRLRHHAGTSKHASSGEAAATGGLSVHLKRKNILLIDPFLLLTLYYYCYSYVHAFADLIHVAFSFIQEAFHS